MDLQITVLPWPKCIVLLADPAAIKELTCLLTFGLQVITSRAKFPKPVDLYAPFAFFGANIVTSEGEEWRKYRKRCSPAFSNRNNKLVWDETIRIMADLFGQVWDDGSEIVVDHFLDVTVPIALFVIGVAGRFGRRVTWADDLTVPPGHQLTFKDAFHVLSTNLIMKIILPDWAKNITDRTRKVHLAFVELKQYMLEMVEARRNGNKAEQCFDLLSGLLGASQDDPNNGATLILPTILGNMFIFLLAGHETTAHTLCFSFALLALYPDEQERLYEHVKGVLSSLNGTPAYEDMSRFTYALAVLFETLRMFPPAPVIPKVAAEDTTLTVSNAEGGQTTFPVPSGTEIHLHVAGLHYNPRYWKDPHRFRPERFLGDWPKDAFIPFSQGISQSHQDSLSMSQKRIAGARACLGRRFFETQGIAVMAMLVSKYKIEIKEEPQFAGETFEERYARITAFEQVLTTTPLRVPLVLRRR
ncbi:cytochrome P450 [Russula earlei]|uniref:Cytochrome P450 n=1 Tax=Russula earlei TaxID=71964 RepID=A0ACC0TVL7_9AGAM|nr:cytochrome P450 [Russula earlei]